MRDSREICSYLSDFEGYLSTKLTCLSTFILVSQPFSSCNELAWYKIIFPVKQLEYLFQYSPVLFAVHSGLLLHRPD